MAAPSGLTVIVDLGPIAAGAAIGDSVALSGVCCTLTTLSGGRGSFDLSAETLRRTWLGALQPGESLNLERALRVGDALGGHFVQGHVDGVGEVVRPIGGSGGEWWVRVPEPLLRYCVEKGSIAIDGVSLTIAVSTGDRIMAAIVPHTAQHTTIALRDSGAPVNVEVDILAKHVEQLLGARLPPA